MADTDRIERLPLQALRFSKPCGEPTPAASIMAEPDCIEQSTFRLPQFSKLLGEPTPAGSVADALGIKPNAALRHYPFSKRGQAQPACHIRYAIGTLGQIRTDTALFLRQMTPTVGLRGRGAARAIRTLTAPGLSRSPLPIGLWPRWSPVAVLTRYLRLERAPSRPLDERANGSARWFRPTCHRFQRPAPRPRSIRLTRIKLGCPPWDRTRLSGFRDRHPHHEDHRAKLVPAGWDRTSVHRLQGDDPTTERYRHWGGSRVLAPLLRLHRATCPLVHQTHHHITRDRLRPIVAPRAHARPLTGDAPRS